MALAVACVHVRPDRRNDVARAVAGDHLVGLARQNVDASGPRRRERVSVSSGSGVALAKPRERHKSRETARMNVSKPRRSRVRAR